MAAERRKGKYATTSGGLRRKVVYLPPEAEAELREAAHRLERTESDLLREALREYLDRLRGEERGP
jgi:predicted DNA-binding protein